VAKKSGAREMVFKRGVCDFTAEPWTKRVVFCEEIEDHCGLPRPHPPRVNLCQFGYGGKVFRQDCF